MESEDVAVLATCEPAAGTEADGVVPAAAQSALAHLSRDEVVERLAERLYWNMQRLDPDIDAPDADGLTDRQRRFYCLLVDDLIDFEEIIAVAPSS